MGTSEEQLWFAREKGGISIPSFSSHTPVKRMDIKILANPDRQALACLIVFPDQDMAYRVESPAQLHAIISKLYSVYTQITGQGQSRVVSFTERKDWTERRREVEDARQN